MPTLKIGFVIAFGTLSFAFGPLASRCAATARLPRLPVINPNPRMEPFTQTESDTASILMKRVGKPTQANIDTFKKAGMRDVKAHALTPEERKAVEAALAALPALNLGVLEHHLHRLAFVDGIPGEGTGLTSPNQRTGLSDITLRSSVITESLETFLTTKEKRVFEGGKSPLTLTVAGTGTNSLAYVLLHESTHVVDASCGITTDPNSKFVAGVWSGHSTFVPTYATITPKTYFRSGERIPLEEAPSIYGALAQTPFVSLYATASRQEDFAELVAWHEIYKQHAGNLVIELRNAEGTIVERWYPLTFPHVQQRFTDVDQLLSSHLQCAT